MKNARRNATLALGHVKILKGVRNVWRDMQSMRGVDADPNALRAKKLSTAIVFANLRGASFGMKGINVFAKKAPDSSATLVFLMGNVANTTTNTGVQRDGNARLVTKIVQEINALTTKGVQNVKMGLGQHTEEGAKSVVLMQNWRKLSMVYASAPKALSKAPQGAVNVPKTIALMAASAFLVEVKKWPKAADAIANQEVI